MRHLNVIIAVFISTLSVNLSFAQRDITLRQYSVSEGLSQSTITTLYCDKKGIIWIGTCNGVNIWRGNKISTLSGKNGKSTEGNIIRSISGIDDKHLLIGTEEGVFLQNTITGSINKYKFSTDKIKDKMLRAYTVGDYLIIFTRENKMLIHELKLNKTKVFITNLSEGKNTVQTYLSKIFWLTQSPGALFSFDSKTGKIEKYNLPEMTMGQTLYSLYISAYGRLYISAEKSITVFNNPETIPKYYSYKDIGLEKTNPGSKIYFASEDEYGTVWVGITGMGVYRYSKDFLLRCRYNEFENNITGSKGNLNYPVCFYSDKSGNVFIGTDGSGLIKINPFLQKFKQIIPTVVFKNDCSNDFISAVYRDIDGNIYFGTINSGLYVYNPLSGYKKYHNKIYGSGNEINKINFILQSDNQNLIIGTDVGLSVYDLKSKRLIPVFDQNQIIYTTACKTNSGKIILGSAKGLYLLENGVIKRIETGYVDQITFVAPYKDNGFLIAEKGDKMYYSDDVLKSNIFPISIPSVNIPQKPIYNSVISADNIYYAGTSFGLIELDDKMVFRRIYTKADGLPDNHIYSMAKGKNGLIWITTNKGISCFISASKDFFNFDIKDGLQSYEFNTGAISVSSDGQIVAGGVNGINYMYEDSISLCKTDPVIELTGMKIQNRDIDLDSFNINNIVELNYLDNNLLFRITATEYTRPEDNKTMVFLSGIDRTWNNPDEQSDIRYNFLPSGEYELFAIASNSDKHWSKPVSLIKFRIIPPVWERPWFITLLLFIMMIAISFLFYFIYLYNIRKKIRSLKQLREIEQVRIRISREIHDDIGSGLTQIAIITEQLEAESANEKKNYRTADKIKKINILTREIIQSMSEIVWMTNPVHDSLQSLIVYLRQTINRMTEETSIDLSVYFPDDLPDVAVNSAARRKIIQMVKEAVNNSIKHSGCTKLIVQTELKEGFIIFSVTDNGCGIDSSLKNNGNGLRNMQQNASETGLSFIVENTGKGTRTEFSGLLSKITTKM